jgi:hypothetical protein
VDKYFEREDPSFHQRSPHYSDRQNLQSPNSHTRPYEVYGANPDVNCQSPFQRISHANFLTVINSRSEPITTRSKNLANAENTHPDKNGNPHSFELRRNQNMQTHRENEFYGG